MVGEGYRQAAGQAPIPMSEVHRRSAGRGKDHTRVEDERKKDKERQKGLQPSAPLSEVESRLRRDTPFVCHIRFKNDLPEIPSDPKLLLALLEPPRLAQFSLTTLELEPRRNLVLGPDLGIHLSLLDMERWSVPAQPAELDPADAALIGDVMDEALTNSTPFKRVRERVRNAELSWLLRTTYVSSDSEAFRARAPKAARRVVPAAQAMRPQDDRERQIAEIEASFAAATRQPVHSLRPDLRPVEVLPVLPDLELWPDKFYTLQFDNDPASEWAELKRLPERQRRRVAERSMLAYDEDKKVLGLLMPRAIPPLSPDASAGGAASMLHEDEQAAIEALEGEYAWVKEYVYSLQLLEAGDASGAFVLRERDGMMSYCQLKGRMTLRRRKRPDGKHGGGRSGPGGGRHEVDMEVLEDEKDEHAWRPSKVTVVRRPYTEKELNRREMAFRKLEGGEVEASESGTEEDVPPAGGPRDQETGDEEDDQDKAYEEEYSRERRTRRSRGLGSHRGRGPGDSEDDGGVEDEEDD